MTNSTDLFDLVAEIVEDTGRPLGSKNKPKTAPAAKKAPAKKPVPASKKGPGAQAKTAKQRAASKKRHLTTAKGKAISRKLKGKPKSAAHKKNISKGMKRYWAAYKKNKSAFPKRKVRKSSGKKPAAKKAPAKKPVPASKKTATASKEGPAKKARRSAAI